MLIDAHCHVENPLDVGHGRLDVEQCPVRRRAGHLQAVGLGKLDESLIILFRRPESLRELPGRQILTKTGTAWSINVLQEVIKALLVAPRHADCQLESCSGRKTPNSWQL